MDKQMGNTNWTKEESIFTIIFYVYWMIQNRNVARAPEHWI